MCVCARICEGSPVIIETGNKQDVVEEVVTNGVNYTPPPFFISHTQRKKVKEIK